MLRREPTDDLRALIKVDVVVTVLFVVLLAIGLRVTRFGAGWYVCGVLGVGLAVQLWKIRAVAADERIRTALRRSGRRVDVRLVEVLREDGDDDCFRARFKWTNPVDGREIEMTSDPIATEPSAEWRQRQFAALIDPQDPGRHLVEIG